ncbi:hypothetical protein EIP91_002795 [Steccherinum ochraceum]|uniref:Transmembrane protein n=1 Tax=Steccherinum ochraceum TaxID=92696 RepID=A0A4R0RJX0_9APHY|nr:hypothetical protein EIP91_002795 [Steccherinum ochraceum]
MDLSQIPNPLYPLAWVPPDTAKQVEIVRYILVGCSAVIGNINNCHANALAQELTGSFQYIFNTLLFVFRVRGVFYHHRYVVWFFYLMWLAVVASCLIAPFGLDAVALPFSGLCVHTRSKHSAAVGVVCAINDTLVFAFITVKLIMQAHGPGTVTSLLGMLFSGNGMGHVSRVVMQTGQLYYLSVCHFNSQSYSPKLTPPCMISRSATAGITIAGAVVVLSPAVPTQYTDVLIVVNGFMTNIMTTRVYRLLKLRFIDGPATDPSLQVQISALEIRVRSSVVGSSQMDTGTDGEVLRTLQPTPRTCSIAPIAAADEWKLRDLQVICKRPFCDFTDDLYDNTISVTSIYSTSQTFIMRFTTTFVALIFFACTSTLATPVRTLPVRDVEAVYARDTVPLLVFRDVIDALNARDHEFEHQMRKRLSAPQSSSRSIGEGAFINSDHPPTTNGEHPPVNGGTPPATNGERTPVNGGSTGFGSPSPPPPAPPGTPQAPPNTAEPQSPAGPQTNGNGANHVNGNGANGAGHR